jgi:hypothetical protein
MVQQLQLRKFDMSSISFDKIVVLIGKRDTGKSFLVKDLLYHHRDLPIGTVISSTESANCFFGNMVPPIFIHEKYTPNLVTNVVKRQKVIKSTIDREERRTGGCSKIDPRAFFIMDDCMHDANTWIKDDNIRLIFMNGRHYKLMYLLTMQHPLGIPPSLRTQIDYVFILRENLYNNRKKIYDNYAGMFPSFEFFCQVMDHCTENYECLVINNNAKSNRIEDQVFWYKAEAHPNFRMGAREFWAISDRLMAQQDEEDDLEGDTMFDASSFKQRRNSPSVSIRKKQ